MLRSFNLFFLIFLLCSCAESFDLADEEFDNVYISDEELVSPTWEGSVQEIVETKCSICHTVDRSTFVPANTPVYLDNIDQQSYFATFKGLTEYRVFDTLDDPMPPDYSTPLTDDEKQALFLYLQSL